MVTIFPNLLSWSLIAPLILRITIGLYFFLRGLKTWKDKDNSWHKWYSGFEIVLGVLFLLGALTQIASIFTIFDTTIRLGKKLKDGNLTEKTLFVFVIATAISLLFSSAGFYAFDLPL
jgi:type IV secretory pathway VirB2 component (pilin)